MNYNLGPTRVVGLGMEGAFLIGLSLLPIGGVGGSAGGAGSYGPLNLLILEFMPAIICSHLIRRSLSRCARSACCLRNSASGSGGSGGRTRGAGRVVGMFPPSIGIYPYVLTLTNFSDNVKRRRELNND